MTTKKSKAAEAAPKVKVVVAYKGFDKDFVCSPNGVAFQYVIGQSYTHDGDIRACKSGFHACRHPLSVWSYYGVNKGNRFCLVEQSGEMVTEGDKTISQKITIKAEIGIPGLIKAAIEWTRKAASPTSGNYAHSATSGDYAHSATSGYYAHSATSGDYARSATSGNSARSATSGNYAHSATSGSYAHSATSGSSAHSATSGYSAHSATSGDSANSATSGDSANSATSGYSAKSSARGVNAVAANAGDGPAKAGVGGAIFIVERNDDRKILAVFASLVGENGIKADTWYELRDGKPIEATP